MKSRKRFLIEPLKFTFATNSELEKAESRGYIEEYDIARFVVRYGKNQVDYPVRTKEEYVKELDEITERGGIIIKEYQDKMSFDIEDYNDDDGGSSDDEEYSKGGKVKSKKIYAILYDSMGNPKMDLEVASEDKARALQSFQDLMGTDYTKNCTIRFSNNEPYYYSKGGNVVSDCEKCGSKKISVKENGLIICKECSYIWMPKDDKYKLGEKWKSDFDYDGMLDTALKANISWGVKKLDKLFDSFESVSYHYCNQPLFKAIQFLEKGETDAASDKIKEFHVRVKEQQEEEKKYNSATTEMATEMANGGIVANSILSQLGGSGRLNAMTGAYAFGDTGNGLSFKIKNQKANYVKITLNSRDLYDVEVGRTRGYTYKVVNEATDLFADQLKPFIEQSTGMYLSLFSKGGNIKFIPESDKHKTWWGRKGYKDYGKCVGSFDIRENGKIDDFYLYELDSFDKDYYSHLKLKDGEKLYRYETEATKIGGYFPLIKVSVKRGLIYFMEDMYSDDDKNPVFYSRGIKPMYLSLHENEKV